GLPVHGRLRLRDRLFIRAEAGDQILDALLRTTLGWLDGGATRALARLRGRLLANYLLGHGSLGLARIGRRNVVGLSLGLRLRCSILGVRRVGLRREQKLGGRLKLGWLDIRVAWRRGDDKGRLDSRILAKRLALRRLGKLRLRLR